MEQGWERGRPDSAEPCIWAMGGGKGGTGKSVMSSSLGVGLASRGQRCVLIDADFGGANLHTLLGVPEPKYTLSHFLTREVEELSDVMNPTPIPNLWLISGTRALLHMANVAHGQKGRLLAQIRQLSIEHVVLDLGAGSSYNELDFFIEAQQPILGVIPEPTSIENAYHFLKGAFFRSLRRAVVRSPVRGLIRQVIDERKSRVVHSPVQLIAEVTALNRAAGDALRLRAESFAPRLIVNQVRLPAQRSLGDEIRETTRRYLGSPLEYVGCLPRDECVHDAVRRREPVLKRYPGCAFSREFERVLDRLLNGETRKPVPHYPQRHDRSLYDERYFLSHGEADPRHDEVLPVRALGKATPTGPDLSRPAELLRHWREQHGFDFAEMSRRTRIRDVESLEGECYAKLPPEPYLRGWVVEYARALGIVEAEALASSYLDRYRRAHASYSVR